VEADLQSTKEKKIINKTDLESETNEVFDLG